MSSHFWLISSSLYVWFSRRSREWESCWNLATLPMSHYSNYYSYLYLYSFMCSNLTTVFVFYPVYRNIHIYMQVFKPPHTHTHTNTFCSTPPLSSSLILRQDPIDRPCCHGNPCEETECWSSWAGGDDGIRAQQSGSHNTNTVGTNLPATPRFSSQLA